MPAPSRESIEGAAETSDKGVRAVSSIETRYWCCRQGDFLPRPVGLSPGKCGVARVEGESGGQPDNSKMQAVSLTRRGGRSFFGPSCNGDQTERQDFPKLANRQPSPSLICLRMESLPRQRLFSILSIGLIRFIGTALPLTARFLP